MKNWCQLNNSGQPLMADRWGNRNPPQGMKPIGARYANFLPLMALCREAQDGRELPRRVTKLVLSEVEGGGAGHPLLNSYKNHLKKLCWLFTISIFACVNPGQTQDLVTPLYNQGIALYSQKDYHAAADYLGQVCDLSPTHAQARFYLIYCLTSIRQFDKAFHHSKILSSQEPSNQQYSILRDQLQKTLELIQNNNYPSRQTPPGHQETKPSTPKSPSNPSSKPSSELSELNSALEALDAQNFADATQILEAILAKDPKNVKALHYRGVVESQQGKYDSAQLLFEKALAEKPEMFETLFLSGEAYMKAGKVKEAEEKFSKAVSIKEDVFALLNLAEAKKRLDKIDESLELLNKVLTIDPNIVEAKLSLADISLEKGNIQQAAAKVNEVLATDPANSLAHYIKGKVLFKGNLIDDAISELKKAINNSNDNPFYKYYLARILLQKERGRDALEIGNDLMKSDPNSCEARLILAEALLLNGETANAQEHLNQAERMKPSAELFRLKAKVARRLGNNEGAKEMYRACIYQDLKNGSSMLEYARFLEEISDQETAVEIYKEVIKRFPDSWYSGQAQAKLDLYAPHLAPTTPSPTKPNPPGKSLY